jgi:hypothetical protein
MAKSNWRMQDGGKGIQKWKLRTAQRLSGSINGDQGGLSTVRNKGQRRSDRLTCVGNLKIAKRAIVVIDYQALLSFTGAALIVGRSE